MCSKEFVVLVALVVACTAEVPSYFKICGRRNPHLDKCIQDSIQDLKEKMLTGIPELDVPGMEPWYMSELTLAEMPSFKAFAKNVSITGLANYIIDYLHVDLEKETLDIEITFKEVKVNAIYDVSAKILVEITGKGPIFMSSNNVKAKVRMDFATVMRGSKKYVYFTKMTTHLTIKDYEAKFEPPGGIDSPIMEAVNTALGNSHQEIIEAVTPNLEKGISESILRIGNKICKHFTFDELYPDRE